MPHNSNGRHQVGGILALLASGSLLLASCAPVDQASADQAPVDRTDCDDWNTRDFFDQATAADVARCISQGADPNARNKDGMNPLHILASGWPDWLWERAPNWHDLEAKDKRAIILNSEVGREDRLRMQQAWDFARSPYPDGSPRPIPQGLGVLHYPDGTSVRYNPDLQQFEPLGGWSEAGAPGYWERRASAAQAQPAPAQQQVNPPAKPDSSLAPTQPVEALDPAVGSTGSLDQMETTPLKRKPGPDPAVLPAVVKALLDAGG
ncbi:MAG: hypothetical protein F4X84_02415 [Synechococcus sp. SB0662_bin_45]|nr:hypothetical protein [Synechococcus sp. SB0662_bin_45]